MDYLRIVLLSLFSILILFLLTKLMGSKQISQLTTFDYITGITIGSIAAEMAIADDVDFLEPMTAMLIYGLAAAFLSLVTNKSIRLRKIISGQALLIFDDGKLYKKNLAKAKLDAAEFLSLCRSQGYFDLSELSSVYLEPNGKLSVLPRAAYKPISANELGIKLMDEKAPRVIIQDGRIINDNLKQGGKNLAWLNKKLSEQGISSVREVFLATVDSNNKLDCYIMTDKN